ncbi:MAG: UDP-N-acetylglucosamine diphosphorylase [Oscillospiraceae bacterium]|jgi:bifunctional UDP-N-acetylglucosamine pyrophosphorylase/glucosamine-1-phosphate N-acetyltransferase|nr:UDP-N-acetylglucosamine diphosphorylase [Oscillospiraceae bacterium]
MKKIPTNELEVLSAGRRRKILRRLRRDGVSIPCADGVIIGAAVSVGAGTLILPGTLLQGETTVGGHCVLGPNTWLRDCSVGEGCVLNSVHGEASVVGDGAQLGPFVRLRPGTVLEKEVRVGNFVEIKNAAVGAGTKIAHLSYIGDAALGRDVNVGCGLATANYDGRHKHRTVVGDGAFIGCHNSLVAPVTVGAGAYTAAGSTITEDVPPGALAIARARQENKLRAKNGGDEGS